MANKHLKQRTVFGLPCPHQPLDASAANALLPFYR